MIIFFSIEGENALNPKHIKTITFSGYHKIY